MINQAFRDMIATLLPDVSEQESFFTSLQQPLKKSCSINRHRQVITNTETGILNNEGSSSFEKNNPDFILGQTPFGEFEDTVYVDRDDMTLPLGKTRQHLTGQLYIQEVAAALPANILKGYLSELYAESGVPLTILDTCAAPGGKSAQLADYMIRYQIPGVVRGNDVDTKRLISRSSNIQRCGLYNTVATKMDASRFGNLYPESFDAILVDAPCSGEGTGFKSDAAYKRRKQESINNIVGLQEHIVTSAIKACKVGGIVVYSTCTLNPFENELQINKLLDKYGDALEILPIDLANKSTGISLSMLGDLLPPDTIDHIGEQYQYMLRAWPHRHHTGGFFVCVMKKRHSTLKAFQHHITDKRHTKSTKDKLPYLYQPSIEKMIIKLLSNNYGITLDTERYAVIQGRKKIHLTDRHVVGWIEREVRLHECGVPIFRPTGKTYSLEHECGLILGSQAIRNTLSLTDEQLQSYCLGEDIAVSVEDTEGDITSTNHYRFLLHRGQGVGVGKVIDGVIKNKFMKR